MILRFALIASIICLLPTAAWSQQSEESKKSVLFLESVSMPKKAKVCAEHIEGFGSKFEPAFRKWQQVNQAQLAEGEALLRVEAERTFSSFEQSVQAITNLSAQMLSKASPDVLEQNCNAMLAKLSAGGNMAANSSFSGTPGGAR